MLIDCPACARSYHVSRAEIGENGRTVICPRCEAQWFVYGDGTSTLMPSPDDLQTASFSARPAVVPFDVAARPSFWRSARPAMAAVACLVFATAAIGARQRIVRVEPRLATLYATIGLPVNVRGLDIVALAPQRLEGADMMVSGAIQNVAARRVVVPRLVYEVRDAQGARLVTWTETAPARTLGTGKTLPFVSAPHALPQEGRSVLVRFEDNDPAPPLRLARRTN